MGRGHGRAMDRGGRRPHRLPACALGGGENIGRPLLQVLSPFSGGDDEGDCAVRLEAAIEEAEGFADHTGAEVLFHGQGAVVHHGLGIAIGMLPAGHGDGAELFRPDIEIVHVARHRKGAPVDGGHDAERGKELFQTG